MGGHDAPRCVLQVFDGLGRVEALRKAGPGGGGGGGGEGGLDQVVRARRLLRRAEGLRAELEQSSSASWRTFVVRG